MGSLDSGTITESNLVELSVICSDFFLQLRIIEPASNARQILFIFNFFMTIKVQIFGKWKILYQNNKKSYNVYYVKFGMFSGMFNI